MTTTRSWVRAIAALVILAVLLVGVPWALVSQVGWPLPTAISSLSATWNALQASEVPDAVIVKILAVIVWVAWAEVAASFLLEATAVARGHVVRQVRTLGLAQTAIATLVAAVLTMSWPSKSVVTHQPLPFVLAVANQAPITPASDVTLNTLSSASATNLQTYTVVRRDNLWSISERNLGDPKRWPEIFELNKGKPQADGASLQQADLIKPGWVLQLPVTVAQPSFEPNVVAPSQTTPSSALKTPLPNTSIVVDSDTPPMPTTPTEEQSSSVSSGESSPKAVALSSGSIVGLGLAAGISGALAITRHRRRSRLPIQEPLADIVFNDPSISDDVRRLRQADLENGGAVDADRFSMFSFRPGKVAIGVDGYEGTLVDLTQQGLIELDDSSMDAVRSFAITHLTAGHGVDTEVRIVGSTLARALVGSDADFEGLVVEENIDTALSAVEAELISRRRLCEELDVENVRDLATKFPADRVPLTLCVFRGISQPQRSRLVAVTDQGSEVGISALVVTAQPESLSLPVVTHPHGLTRAESTELVELVAESRRWNEDDASPVYRAVKVVPETFALPADPDTIGRLARICVFGAPRIVVGESEVRTTMRGKSLELAAFLACRPVGASLEVIGAALWPEANGKQVSERIATVNSDLRKALRLATGRAEEKFVERTKTGYRLDSSVVSCDVWDFEAALNVFQSSGDAGEGRAALKRAVNAYSNHLCSNATYEWADDVREHLRRRALDAFALHAEFDAKAGDNAAALATLERSIELDPYREELYRRLMALQITMGRPDAALRSWDFLVQQLEMIDVEPAESTKSVIAEVRSNGSRVRNN